MTSTATAVNTPTRAVVVPAVFGLFAGSLLANAVPHTLFGLTGVDHLSPFGTSPTVNLLWGVANLLMGIALVLPPAARRARVPFIVGAAAGSLGTAISLFVLWS